MLCQRFCQRLVWLILPCRRKHSCGTIMLCLGQGHQTMMWPAQHTVKGFAPASDASVCEVTVQPFPYCGIPLIRFLRTSCLQGFWHLCACHILSLLSSAATCVGANVHLALAEQQAAQADSSAPVRPKCAGACAADHFPDRGMSCRCWPAACPWSVTVHPTPLCCRSFARGSKLQMGFCCLGLCSIALCETASVCCLPH